MIDYTKPVQTRNGLEVEIITTKGRGDQPVIGYIGKSDVTETWGVDGMYFEHGCGESISDLVNVPEPPKVICVLNVYADSECQYGAVCRTRVYADGHAGDDRTHVVNVYCQPDGTVTAEVEATQ
jgi:hypothetical protein